MKLIVTDLDGTLLTNDKKITDYTRESLKNFYNQGIEIVIATGRGYFSTKDIKNTIGIPMFMICNNGANIYDKNEKIIHSTKISKEIVKELVKDFEKFKVDYRIFYGINYYYPKYGVVDIKRSEYKGSVIQDINDCEDSEKILVVESNRELFEKFKDYAVKKYGDILEVVASSHDCLDFNAKGCNKKEGLVKVLEHYNISSDDIIAFGDSENDYKMLKYVGHGVGMKDSHISKTDIKNETEFTNNFDGVVKYLESRIKGKNERY